MKVRINFSVKEKEDDIYSEDFIEDLIENDEISYEEEGFMKGYIED